MRIQIQYKGTKKVHRSIKRTRSGLITHVKLKLRGQN